jgi:large subunit ribosomal protein L9
MQILLLQDVDNLGYAGDVKKVADGFGRNYLLPRNLAVLATPGALKQSETIRKAAEKRRAHEMADAQAMANQLAGVELYFERRAGETGKLYGSVTSGDIADGLKTKTGLEIDKRKVALPEPIRQLGQQEVTIKLMIDVATSVKVHVLPEGGILERERLTKAEEAKALAAVVQPASEPEAKIAEPEIEEVEAKVEEPEIDEPLTEEVEIEEAEIEEDNIDEPESEAPEA